MKPEDMVILSFYKELSTYKEDSSVTLVQHIDTKKLYVKKVIPSYNINLYTTLHQLDISGIPSIHHIIPSDDGQLIILEDFINGKTLDYQLNHGHHYTEKEAALILLQLCDPLQALHNASPPIIHRDIKPSNIIISDNLEVTLIDFNASKLYDAGKTHDTILMGTVDYAAPEQFGFRQSDPRTDIYAMGVLLNVLLTGKLPKDGLYSGKYTAIIEKCTSMDPGKRYSSIGQLEKALKRQLSYYNDAPCQESVVTSPTSWVPPGFRTGKIRNIIVALLGYTALFWFAAVSEFEGMGQVQTVMNRIAIILWGLSTIAIFTNYRNFAGSMPISRSSHPIVKYAGCILWTAVFMIIALMLPDALYNLFAA